MSASGRIAVPSTAQFVQLTSGAELDLQWDDGLNVGWAYSSQTDNQVMFLRAASAGYLVRPLRVPKGASGIFLQSTASSGTTNVALTELCDGKE